MSVTNYYSIGGEIIAEKPAASTRVDYLTDALGSVTSTMNQSAAIVNTYRYKPYGAQLAKTGAGVDPSFRWVGTLGYRQTGKKYSDVYVRARHYDDAVGRWTTKDSHPLARYHQPYGYSFGQPSSLTDRSGRLPQSDCWPDLDQDCCSPQNQDYYFNNVIGSHCKGGSWSKDCHAGLCVPQATLAECKAIADRLSALADGCNTMCNGGGYGSDSPWGAATMCCYDQTGKPKFCDRRCCRRNLPPGPGYGCILKCLMQHEDSHSNVDCKIPLTDPWPNDDPWDFRFDECRAYRTEIRCLLTLYSDKCARVWSPDLGKSIAKCLSPISAAVSA